MKNILFGMFVAGCLYSCQYQPAGSNAQSSDELRAQQLLAKMTLDEKIGQMNQVTGSEFLTGPGKADQNTMELIKKGLVGSLLNVTGDANLNHLQHLAVDSSRLGIPLIFGYDVIHGYKTIFPVPLGDAASFDLDAIEMATRVAAIEASAEGLHWTFAPMVDICRDARWGRIMEGAGEDTYWGSLVAKARVKGFQGSDLRDTASVLACAKHFIGYGAAEAGRDYNTVDMSRQVLFNTYMPPFKAAVDAGVGSFMNGFCIFEGVPVTGHPFLVRETLKNNWKYNGFVVSDWNSIGEMINHGVVADNAGAAELAIKAGNDMDMMTFAYQNNLKRLVEEGKVPLSMVDEAVLRILTMKYKLGLFDNPYKGSNRNQNVILSERHKQLSRESASKSMVLLKNEGVLPLSLKGKKVALIGPLADSQADMIGSWQAKGNPADVITLKTSLETSEAVSVKTVKGCDITDENTGGFKDAVDAARWADVVILAVGESAPMTGESNSRGTLNLPGVQSQLVAKVKEAGKPVVMVLFTGRPLILTDVVDKADAILVAWLPGTMAGPAVTDVLTGAYNPSGKLPATFPYALGQLPIYYNHLNTGRPGGQHQPYSSRYIDIPNEPLFAFGYGLSYTQFKYGQPVLSASQMNMADTLIVTIPVSNIGKLDGATVVQLYLRDKVASMERPVKELRGVKRIVLKAGEQQTVQFKISKTELSFYNANLDFVAEPGDFDVMVGSSSRDEDLQKLTFALK
jgi:beta-glucosidase